MKASEAGKVEYYVKRLLDGGADNMQNKVSDVIIHFIHAIQQVVNDDVCAGTLFSACMW